MELFVPDVHVCFIFLTVSAGFLHNCSLGRSKCEQIKPNKTIKTMYIYLQINTHIPRAQLKNTVNVQKRKLKKYCNYPELLDLWHPACNQCMLKPVSQRSVNGIPCKSVQQGVQSCHWFPE